MKQAISMGCLGQPKDIAYATFYLTSDEARYVTGQTIVVEGGQVFPESLSGIF
jgi:3-oxoacyl-[acyl-carrier protein] reductase